MSFLKRSAPETPEILFSALAYRRWLRAHRPPFEWFVAQPEDDQEVMAQLGDQFSGEIAEAVQITSAANVRQARQPASEESALRRLAAEHIRAANGRSPSGLMPGAKRAKPAPAVDPAAEALS